MATNITSAAAFTTSNMKPDANDQADALWAQNLADNTGYLYYKTKEIHIPTVSGGPSSWFVLFTKLAAQSILRVKVRGDNVGSAAAVTDQYRVYADGVDTGAGVAVLSANNSYTRGVNTTAIYNLDISTLTNDVNYILKITLDSTKTFHAPGVSII